MASLFSERSECVLHGLVAVVGRKPLPFTTFLGGVPVLEGSPLNSRHVVWQVTGSCRDQQLEFPVIIPSGTGRALPQTQQVAVPRVGTHDCLHLYGAL